MKTSELSAVRWRKSSHSGPTGGDCVEVARSPSGVAVRDSKHPGVSRLALSRAVFGELVRELRRPVR
ncbi:DUF397 domain-containing protein [Actinocorallia libanotica]|uniref:DUF397 domain-containing protein n=1 Tax=Actinocorallia libanotica TaxID=46162 RepID=A0ABN1QBJ0_9ACTN